MSEYLERYDRIATAFTARVEAVPEDAWDAPAPCDGWVARDVVRHLVEWMPGLFAGGWGLTMPDHPSVDDDPVAAWTAVDAAIRGWLADPAVASREADILPGRFSLEQAVDMFGTGDVFVHTWDLAAGDRPRRDPRPGTGAPDVRGDGADGRGAAPERAFRPPRGRRRRRGRADQAHRLHGPHPVARSIHEDPPTMERASRRHVLVLADISIS